MLLKNRGFVVISFNDRMKGIVWYDKCFGIYLVCSGWWYIWNSDNRKGLINFCYVSFEC